MNIKTILKRSILDLKGSGILTPELDARVLLEHALEKDSSFILSYPEYSLSISEYKNFIKMIRRRETGEPVAYITGHKEFYGYDFLINKNVLVPRPESEWLIEAALNYIEKQKNIVETNIHMEYKPALFDFSKRVKRRLGKLHPYKIIDVGTGSGSLIVALNKELKKTNPALKLDFFGSDNSSRAVAVAKKNAKKFKARNIVFLNSDLFGNRRIKNKLFDIIIANLPYVPRAKKVVSCQLSVVSSIKFEPQDAIFADDNGMAVIKKFLLEARKHIQRGGMILLELDPRNALDLLEFSRHHYPTASISLKKDLAGLERYLIIKIKK